jgi:hypothetical protein
VSDGAVLSQVAHPATESRSKRGPLERMLTAGCVLLLLVAGGLVVLSRQASSDAQVARAQAKLLGKRSEQLRASGDSDESHAEQIDSLTKTVTDDLQSAEDALDAAVAAQNKLSTIGSQSASLFNEGEVSASQSLMAGQGQAALADVATTTAAAAKAVAALTTAASQLEAAVQ